MSAKDKFIWIPTKQLVKAPWNYKEEDAEMQEKLVANIDKNDQLENIIVRELPKKNKKDIQMYEVVNGNHRLDAFNSLGFEEVFCRNLGDVTEAHAAVVAIETNETKFKSDNIKLSALLTKVKGEFSVDELVKTMPFDINEIENFKNLTDFNWAPPTGSAEAEEEPVLGEGGEPNKNAGDSRPAVENSNPETRNINLKLPSDIAEMFEHQVKRVKKLLYPDQLEEHVSVTLPLQAMLQIIAETDDSRFK